MIMTIMNVLTTACNSSAVSYG